MRVKIGVRKDGRLTAGDAELKFQGGAFPGSLVDMGAMAAFACYELENVRVVGYDVVCNRPKLAPYRAPSAPIAAFAVESVMRRARGAHRHRPAGAAPQERRQRGHEVVLRPDLQAHRPRRDDRGGAEAPSLQGEADQEPGARCGLAASGSTSAATRRRRSASMPTAPSPSPMATRTSAARAPRCA